MLKEIPKSKQFKVTVLSIHLLIEESHNFIYVTHAT